jgi:hypothetical protein
MARPSAGSRRSRLIRGGDEGGCRSGFKIRPA